MRSFAHIETKTPDPVHEIPIPVTIGGGHEFGLHYVENTAADQDELSYFRPVENVLDFDDQNRYQQYIAAKSVDLATSLGYHDPTDHGDGIFERMPSPTTINRRVRKYGSKLKQFLPERVSELKLTPPSLMG